MDELDKRQDVNSEKTGNDDEVLREDPNILAEVRVRDIR